MNLKRLISLLTILTLLASVLLPASVHAHLCAGSDAVARSIERNQDHHDDADADEHDHHAAGHHDDADHHDDGDHHTTGTVHSHGSGHADEMSFCCHDGDAPQKRSADNAVLPSRLVLAHAVALLHVLAPSLHFHFPEPARGDFKIGASPPYLASSAHATYLRISVLLI